MKTPKPTGDAECPPHVLRAHYIDDLMNDKAGSRDLDDEDIVDVDEVMEISDDDDDNDPLPKKSSKPSDKKVVIKTEKEDGPVARRATSDRIQPQAKASRRNGNQDILANISNALDPRIRQARNEETSMAAIQATQVFQLSSQLRETQRQLEGLRSQLMDAERRCNAAERRADRAELVGMLPPTSSSLRHPSPSLSTPRSQGRLWRSPILQHRELRDEHLRPRFRQEIRYRDGGSSTRWVGGSDDEGGDDLIQDSPGTHRHTFYDNDNLPPPPSQRQTSPQARRSRAGSPFRSAASPLNNLLNPSTSSSGNTRESHNDIEVRVSPRSNITSGVSVTVVSPCRSDTNKISEPGNA